MSYSFPVTIDDNTNTNTIIKQLPNILIASLAFFVSLNWNDTISSLFDYYIPAHIFGLGTMWMRVINSIIITIVAFMLIFMIIKGSQQLEKYKFI